MSKSLANSHLTRSLAVFTLMPSIVGSLFLLSAVAFMQNAPGFGHSVSAMLLMLTTIYLIIGLIVLVHSLRSGKKSRSLMFISIVNIIINSYIVLSISSYTL